MSKYQEAQAQLPVVSSQLNALIERSNWVKTSKHGYSWDCLSPKYGAWVEFFLHAGNQGVQMVVTIGASDHEFEVCITNDVRECYMCSLKQIKEYLESSIEVDF